VERKFTRARVAQTFSCQTEAVKHTLQREGNRYPTRHRTSRADEPMNSKPASEPKVFPLKTVPNFNYQPLSRGRLDQSYLQSESPLSNKMAASQSTMQPPSKDLNELLGEGPQTPDPRDDYGAETPPPTDRHPKPERPNQACRIAMLKDNCIFA
jgi:hypothetical protein